VSPTLRRVDWTDRAQRFSSLRRRGLNQATRAV
jgi:hypothetical protein